MSSSARWSLVVVGEALLALYFVVLWSGAETAFFRQSQLAIATALGGVGWVVVARRPRLLDPILIAAPLPLLASLVITSLASGYPTLTSYVVWHCATFTGIAWLLCIQAQDEAGRRNLIAAMGVVGLVVIAIYLVTVAQAWLDWLGLGFPLRSLPLRPMYTGGIVQIPAWLADVVILCSPVVVVTLWMNRHRALSIALAVGAGVAIVLSGTRSVLILVAILSVVGALALLIRRGDRRARIAWGLALLVAASVGLGVVISASRGWDLGRTSSFASAISRFTESPLVGSGPGTYGVRRMGDPSDTLFNLAQPDALNVVLTTASDSGIIGLVGLAASVALFGMAIWRAWGARRAGHPIAMAALLSVLVVAGHAMGEVVFALAGTVLLWIAALAIAATTEGIRTRESAVPTRWLTGAAVMGLLVLGVSSAGIIRTERAYASMASAEVGGAQASAAVIAAREATDSTPDSAPAWWVRMVTADAAGDHADAIAAAKRLVALEGFAQQWLALSVLLGREGDVDASRAAIDQAIERTPSDPIVELNAAAIYDSMGDQNAAAAAAVRLLKARPDIEPILGTSMPRVAELVKSVRERAARESIASDQVGSAFLMAMAGEDRALAESMVASIDAPLDSDPDWPTLIPAWFGDQAARATFDAQTTSRPSTARLIWSWLLAARACDVEATDRWERAIGILAAFQPSVPTSIGVAPAARVRALPPRYPGVVWRTDHPEDPNVAGIWTYALGRPACARP